MFQSVLRFCGFQSNVVTSEKLVATLGSLVAISLCLCVTAFITDTTGTMAILPSMGASTVLLFAVPHGQLSTPWAVLAGNVFSAIVGVTCAQYIDNIYIAAPLAVAVAIFVMHLSHCLHPPGGATALAAVIGGTSVHQLGYWYVITPTLINCLILLSVAIAFNNLFSWRRYPQHLMRYQEVGYHPDTRRIEMRHIHEAIARSELVIDASDKQIKHIVDLADAILHEELSAGFKLESGAFYTNGKPGRLWSVRQILELHTDTNSAKHLVIYRVVEGDKKGESDYCSMQEFVEWSSSKMQPKKVQQENSAR
ncbi:HPP family protein [Neptunicella marina]|uniref:HPP family protein n=1 Tax=Neptunicella marina TaxID=2125989 RepID=A0A8J6M2U0_9ALTE|nr:HPP family protein [Neptunicella marina]MBC3764766.1 HPP family protein [Neptunicella marina]